MVAGPVADLVRAAARPEVDLAAAPLVVEQVVQRLAQSGIRGSGCKESKLWTYNQGACPFQPSHQRGRFETLPMIRKSFECLWLGISTSFDLVSFASF